MLPIAVLVACAAAPSSPVPLGVLCGALSRPVLSSFPLTTLLSLSVQLRRYAASMLIPVGVIMYTAHGGLKATFMST